MELDASGHSTCTIRGGGRNPGVNGNCAHSSTHSIAAHYADNNADWVSDFTSVFIKMISQNGDNTELKLISQLDPSKDEWVADTMIKDIKKAQEVINGILNDLEIE